MRAVVTAGYFVVVFAASVQSGEDTDWAGIGSHRVRTLEFGSLADAARSRRHVPIKVLVPEVGGPFPVVVVSHGAGGNWDTNYAQGWHLATHGYTVMCLEHVGSNTAVARADGRLLKNILAMTRDSKEVLNRPADVSFALDQAKRWNRSHPQLMGKFQLSRVGVMGHSFGAYTALVVCGARPSLEWMRPVIEPGSGLAPSMSDRRVRVGIALSPQGPGEPFFVPESFRSLDRPILGISGTKDKQQKSSADNRKRGFQFWPPGEKHLLWLDGADHAAFADSTGSGRRLQLPSKSRRDAQRISRAACLMFLDQHLKHSRAAKTALASETLRSYCGGVVPTLELMSK